jgi:hypothetical protein
VRVERRGGAFWLRDEGTKNGTWIGETAAPPLERVLWRPPQNVRVGRTVLALWEPLSAALATIEGAPDEMVAEAPAPPAAEPTASEEPPGRAKAPASIPPPSAPSYAPGPTSRPVPKRGAGWSITDGVVMGAALCVLALSLAGLVWLLKG